MYSNSSPIFSYSPFSFNGMEKDNEMKGEGNSYDFSARILDSRVGRWLSRDALEKLTCDINPYHFGSLNPINRIDLDGNWDIEVHAYSNRGNFGYALMIVKDNDGNVVYKTTVMVQGSNHEKNNFNARDRTKTNADTPTGVYKMTNWEKKERKSYGPNDALRLSPVSGEIKDSKRDGILVHGGRQEEYNSETGVWSKKEDAVLKRTYGCIRIMDDEIKEIKEITDKLTKLDPTDVMNELKVTNDLVYDKETKSYMIKSDYKELSKLRYTSEHFDQLKYTIIEQGVCILKLKIYENIGIKEPSKTQTTNDKEQN
jgi:RHS repeat-associated protein